MSEDEVQRLLGRTPTRIELSKRQVKGLEKLAREKGVPFQRYVDEMGDAALRGYLKVKFPDNGQHR